MDRNLKVINKIKNLRKLKNLSIEQMAELVNKSKSAYDRLEKGSVEMTLNEAENIATALGSDFITITSNGTIFNNEHNTVIGQGNNPTINLKLDEEQFQKIMEALK